MIALDIVKTWHQVFVSRVYSLLRTGIVPSGDIAVLGDHRSCEFGVWLHNIRQEFEQDPRYQTLDLAHHLFHRATAELFNVRSLTSDPSTLAKSEQTFISLSELLSHALSDFEPHYLKHRLPDASRDTEDMASLILLPEHYVIRYTWNSRPEAAIDEQHMSILSLLNRLLKNPGASTKEQATMDILYSLMHIFTVHFDFEEQILEDSGLHSSQTERHKAGHLKILEEMVNLFVEVTRSEHLSNREVFARVLEAFMIDVRDLDAESSSESRAA